MLLLILYRSTCFKLYKSNEIVKSFNFDEGLQFYDMTKNDRYYFIVCKNIIKQNQQYRVYIFNLLLEFCDVFPVSCKLCSPSMCQICAVGNSIYLLCKKPSITGKETMQKSILIELC